MAKKTFNPSDWLEQQPKLKPAIIIPENKPALAEDVTEIEAIVRQIEEKQIDIASAYSDWRDIGFAFADSFGESGREYFHRISCFYPDYSPGECDKQYSNCLKSQGQGVTLKTFFFHAKQSGISLSVIPKPANSGTGLENQETASEVVWEGQPTLPESLFAQLPDFLKRVVSVADSNEERDILLLGSIVALSACFPKIYGIYDGKKDYSNLFLFITAQASAGKGRLVHCKQLVKPIHKFLREQAKMLKQQYEIDMADYLDHKGKDADAEKPGKPPEKMLFIPANNSTTGVFQLLFDNDGSGLIFETEGDTLAQAFKSDYGNYSDGFRKAFHHETISYYRRTDREYVDMDSPRLSAVLSGTPRQVASLIPNAENGLFSRFIFYFMNIRPVWKNVFAITSDNGLDDYFDNLGTEFFSLYQTLANGPEIQFNLTVEQQEKFNTFFQQTQDVYLSLQGIDYMATIRRLGLIAFRISMILSTLRIMETGNLPERIVCEDSDFQIALDMISILVKHASKVFTELPAEPQMPKRKNQKEKYLDLLPASFNRQDYLRIAASRSIPDKTAEGYITEFYKKGLLHREKQDLYVNPNAKPGNMPNKEIQDSKEVKD